MLPPESGWEGWTSEQKKGLTPQVWGKKSSPGDSGSLFVVEIVLKERDSRGKNNDPVIKDRIKLWLTLCYLGVWVYSAKRPQQGKKKQCGHLGTNSKLGCGKTRSAVQLETLCFPSSMAPFLSDMSAGVGGGRETQKSAFFSDFEELWRHTGYQTGNLQWGRRGGWLCISSG